MLRNMDRVDLWQRLAARPRNARFAEIDQLLRLAGWELHHVRGSHHVYVDGRRKHFSLPRDRGNVKVAYVRLVLGMTQEDPRDD